LSLKGKVTLTLTLVFAAIVSVFLLVLIPLLRQQRARLLDQDRRLLATLRDNHQRQFIYDLLSRNEQSLAVDIAELARQSGILWVRIEGEALDLSATANRPVIRRALADEARVLDERPDEALVLVVRGSNGRADLMGESGRPLLEDRSVAPESLLEWASGPPPAEAFAEVAWDGATALYLSSAMRAAGETYGQLHVLYSLAPLQRSEALTRTLFYALVGTSFLLLLLLLNVFISRIVIVPVRRVLGAMSRASKGELELRLPVHSRDEVGSMALAFNSMVEKLEASKREVEDYSRNLESRVEDRTRELRHSEERLLAVKNHLATVIANVATGVISLDEAGRITTFNERAADILLGRAEPAEGRRLEELLGEDEGRGLTELIASVRAGRSGLRKGQVSCKLPQGRRTLSVVASPLMGEGGRRLGTVVVLDDLTQILASQRLETWKEAVEKVLHEIKNPLTPVGLAAQTLRSAHAEDRAKFDEIFPSATEMILRAVKDLKDLISEFSQFSRLPRVQLRRVDLNALVLEALSPYEQGTIEGVGVEQRLAASLPEIEADPDQLKRVLLNVINNGLEAMDGRGGRLLVATSGPDASGRLRLSVRDQGGGVEDAERIFEPYYTTKVKGTGLGLAIARQIIEEHGGEIQVESDLGTGTTVSILVPAAGPRD
jgi:two-component system nitrogen regulation sensor histidine kinase NtrY